MAVVWLNPAGGLLAARGPALDPRLLWAAIGLVGFVLVGALLLWWVARWRKDAAQSAESSGDQLTDFRVLYERGELSREEFERIRNLLGQRLRHELDVPEAPSQQPPEPPGPGPS